MLAKIFFIIILVGLTSIQLHSQNTYRTLYDVNGQTLVQIQSITQSLDGGDVISSSTQITNVFKSLFVKRDSSGNVEWSYNFQSVQPVKAVQFPDSSYILITFQNYTNGAGYLTHINKNGSFDWTKAFHNFPNLNFVLSDATIWNDSTILLAANDYLFWINKSGQIIHQQKTGIASTVINIIHHNKIYLFGTQNSDATITLCDSIGNIIWIKKIGFDGGAGNAHVATIRKITNYLNGDLLLLADYLDPHIGTMGVIIWTDSLLNIKLNRFTIQQSLNDIIVMPDYSIVLLGYDTQYPFESFISKLDTNQSIQNATCFNNANSATREVRGYPDSVTSEITIAKSVPLKYFEIIKTDSTFNNTCNSHQCVFSLNLGLVSDTIAQIQMFNDTVIITDTTTIDTLAVAKVNNCQPNEIDESKQQNQQIEILQTEEKIFIIGENKTYKWRLYDLGGRNIGSGITNENTVQLNNLIEGLYIIVLTDNEKVSRFKFIINRIQK